MQKTVHLYPAPAVSGDRAAPGSLYAVGNPLAEGDVTAGRFVWAGEATAAPDGSSRCVTVRGSGSGAPAGLVERVLTPGDGRPSNGLPRIPAGSALTVARAGDYWAVTETAARAGQKVFARLADGAVLAGDAGSAVEGAQETDWSFLLSGAAGDCVVISNRNGSAAFGLPGRQGE